MKREWWKYISKTDRHVFDWNINKLINSFPLKGQKWDLMLRKSKFSKSEDYPYLGDSRWYDFGKFHKGKICFQDHPGEVSFKNVRVREIK